MKIIRNVLVFAIIYVAASAQQSPGSVDEQRYFNLEDSIQNKVDLSDADLAALTRDGLMQKELDQDPSMPKLTQEGIAATVVHLCSADERDLVVVGNGAPFAGADVGPFWIIRTLPAGPVVVFGEISLGLSIETKRSKSCLNVQTFTATATVGTTTEFSFDGEKYVVTKQKSQPLSK